jgi:hypothetical protein
MGQLGFFDADKRLAGGVGGGGADFGGAVVDRHRAAVRGVASRCRWRHSHSRGSRRCRSVPQASPGWWCRRRSAGRRGQGLRISSGAEDF